MATDNDDGNDDKTGIYLAHRSALVDYAAGLVKCRSRAEDVVQDAYFRFIPSIPGGPDGPVLLRPVQYLYRIVRNLSLDALRRGAVERAGPLEDAPEAALTAGAATPEQVAIDRQTLARLRQAMGSLPPAARRAFEAHRLQGRSLHQIAEAEGVSVATAHRLVRSALVFLTAEIETPGTGLRQKSTMGEKSDRSDRPDGESVLSADEKGEV